jgi:UDP-2,4-diacetamido-2,4,6-trideoxy-beta-L-altropyranose hydrolase
VSSSKRWFVIRADANPEIGIGHVMRCLALAEWAKDSGVDVVLITKFTSELIENKVEQLDGELVLIPESEDDFVGNYAHSGWLKGSEKEDALLSVRVIEELCINKKKPLPLFIMIDHYALGAPWELLLKQVAPILVVDDLSDREHNCTWLLDQTYGKRIFDYDGLVNPNARLFIGTRYALLRKEFALFSADNARTFPKEKLRILISLGGVDNKNYAKRIVNHLLDIDENSHFEISIVSGGMNPNVQQLKTLSERNENIDVLIDATNIAELMMAHDICIGAVGSTTWERFAMSLPSILCVIADNQIVAAHNLEIENLVRVINIKSNNLRSDLEEHINYFACPAAYRKNIDRISSVCDGMGASLLLNEIL